MNALTDIWSFCFFLSVKHGKKQPTNTRLATADELYTHRRHAHNTRLPPQPETQVWMRSYDDGPLLRTTQQGSQNATLALYLHVKGIVLHFGTLARLLSCRELDTDQHHHRFCPLRGCNDWFYLSINQLAPDKISALFRFKSRARQHDSKVVSLLNLPDSSVFILSLSRLWRDLQEIIKY